MGVFMKPKAILLILAMLVNGTLLSQGSADALVTFTSGQEEPWGYLSFGIGTTDSILTGTLVESAGRGQKYEIQAESIQVAGWVQDPDTYPIQPKQHSLEFLREVAHLRPRTNVIAAVPRVRHGLAGGGRRRRLCLRQGRLASGNTGYRGGTGRGPHQPAGFLKRLAQAESHQAGR